MQEITINDPKKSLNKVKVSEGVKIFDFVNAYQCTIDDRTKVGTFVEIQKNATIWKYGQIGLLTKSFYHRGTQSYFTEFHRVFFFVPLCGFLRATLWLIQSA